MADIILVEDNTDVGMVLSDFLAAEGYDVYHALSGEEAWQIYEEEDARLFLLDIMLPGMDGFAVCSKIRTQSNVPVFIISAKDGKEDKLNGLLLGADDYIEKPYDVDLLLAKIKGVFQRRYSLDEIVTGKIRIEKKSRKLYVHGEEVSLTVKEFDLLLYLVENEGKAIPKEELFGKIWGFDSESELQTLTVHIKWLRQKLEKDPKNPKLIQTVWGVGYRFVSQEDCG